MKKWIAIALMLMLAVTACAEAALPVEIALNSFVSGDYTALEALLSEEVRQVASAEVFDQAWQMKLAELGAFVSAEFEGEAPVFVAHLTHENGRQDLNVALNEEGLIQALYFTPVYELAEGTLPEGATEREVVLFEGTEKELSGAIVSPAQENAPYVVLIHGSGSSDKDETIGPNRPFLDLAYDLAANGVGSIRFDKITYAHPELGAETVTDEYLIPVTEALRVLREQTGATKVYAAGHSQGGMLMPWLVQACGFDGGIALAGTPKPLWWVSYEQNLALLPSVPEEQREVAAAQIEAERQRGENMESLDDGELLFGVPVKYQRSIAELDQIAIAKENGKPMLFVWGEADVQVTQEDFEAWQEGLGEDAQFSYKTYPGLNHLFMPAQEGDSLLNFNESYARPAQMDHQVAADIAAWLASLT